MSEQQEPNPFVPVGTALANAFRQMLEERAREREEDDGE